MIVCTWLGTRRMNLVLLKLSIVFPTLLKRPPHAVGQQWGPGPRLVPWWVCGCKKSSPAALSCT